VDPNRVLNATGVNLTGSIIPNLKVQWLGNGQGVVALYTTGSSFTPAPTTGLLFSVTYQVIGPGSGVQLLLYWQTSPSGPDIDQVDLNTSTGGLLVSVQDGTFNSSNIVNNTTIDQTVTFHDVTATIVGALDLNTTTKTLTGSVSVQAVNNTSGATIFSKIFNISFFFGGMAPVRFVLIVPASPITLGVSCQLSSTSGFCRLTRDPDVSNAGTANIIDFGMIAAKMGSTIGSPNFSPALDLDGNGVVNIIDVGIEGAVFSVPVIY
jgi:hypothetical protein